jgi:hypothetical protein
VQKDYVDKCGDLRYLELMPCTSVQGVNKWREDSLRAAKEETLRRLGRRASLPASEQEGLEETINDVFDAHSFLQGRSIETAYTESLNIAEPVKRNLIDTPDANGVATGPRCGEHCYLAQARICFICRQIFPRQILIQTGKFLTNLHKFAF